MVVGWRSLLVFELAALGACVPRGTFRCDTSAQCGEDGHCEANGYCSRPDDSCTSGSRYAIYAPDGIGGTCVPSGCLVALGHSHACMRSEDNQVACWGDNARGQLGVGDRIDRSELRDPIAELDGARAVAA